MSVSVLNFGCRLNGAEGETLRGLAEAEGLSDLVVVNSCAVTAEAARQAAQAIRRARREKPEARIVATGCAVEIDPGRFASMPEVAHLLGNAEKMRPAIWADLRRAVLPRAATGGLGDLGLAARPASDAGAGRVRAFVEVQNGCDHSCTFCTIPAGRGRSRSVPIPVVIEAIAGAMASGAIEAVLTGVDVTAYGQDLTPPSSLGRLVKAILAALPDLPRLRLSSIDSVEADDDLLDAIATEERLMPHLHLSLQAGDDLVLKRMKRRHARADAIGLCERLRRARPGIVFGADLIAGFPTESEAMFGRSLDLVEECGLTYLHVFPYSPRPGTPAARMPQVPLPLVRERAARLREAGAAALARHLASEVGQSRRVLVEGSGLGRTEAFTPVSFDSPPPRGTIVETTMHGYNLRGLLA